MSIITTKTLDTLIDQQDKCDHQTLIIFDINHVLIKEESAIFNLSGRAHRIRLSKTDWKDLSPEQVDTLWSKILLTEPVSCVDNRIPSIIDTLKKRTPNIIAHTSCPIGSYGDIACLMDWSINRLARNNIRFNGSFAAYDPLALKVHTSSASDTTYFKSGILFNAKHVRFSKGEILASFLGRINWHPSRIIFVDNQIDNIESIEAYAQNAALPFLGIHYTEALEYFKPYDEELARFQFQYLREKGIWLPDHKATALLQQ